jgi:hypothetical protein
MSNWTTVGANSVHECTWITTLVPERGEVTRSRHLEHDPESRGLAWKTSAETQSARESTEKRRKMAACTTVNLSHVTLWFTTVSSRKPLKAHNSHLKACSRWEHLQRILPPDSVLGVNDRERGIPANA